MDIGLFLEIYEQEIAFGILLNIAMIFGFGIYKAKNLDYAQMRDLMEKYPVRTSALRVMFLWFVPFVGTIYTFKELIDLQKQISIGNGVYEYMENKLKREYAKKIDSEK